MKAKLYSVKDVQLNLFNLPMFLSNETLAVRALYRTIDQPDSPITPFAENFFLFELGEWDDETGVVTMLPQPRLIISATTLLDKINFEKKKGQSNENA